MAATLALAVVGRDLPDAEGGHRSNLWHWQCIAGSSLQLEQGRPSDTTSNTTTSPVNSAQTGHSVPPAVSRCFPCTLASRIAITVFNMGLSYTRVQDKSREKRHGIFPYRSAVRSAGFPSLIEFLQSTYPASCTQTV